MLCAEATVAVARSERTRPLIIALKLLVVVACADMKHKILERGDRDKIALDRARCSGRMGYRVAVVGRSGNGCPVIASARIVRRLRVAMMLLRVMLLRATAVLTL
jgi:hypothetical protein